MKRNDLRRAGTRSTQRRPALPRSGTAGCPANPCPPPLPILPPASRHQARPPLGGGGGKWDQMDTTRTCSLLGAKDKKLLISIFGGPKCERCSFPHSDPKKCKIRRRNHRFHKHLRPGGRNDPKMHFMGPRMHFGGAKCSFGLQNACWAPKCSLAKRGQGDYS